MRKLNEDINTLEAVIYDIVQFGEADPIFIRNLKNEYDNVISKRLIMQVIKRLGVIVDYGKVAKELMSHGILIQ